MPHPAAAPDAVESVRRFSRFYTRRLGLLEPRLLASAFTLAEARLLWELAHHEALSAGALARELALDAGYVSRLIQRLHSRGLLRRAVLPADRRQSLLSLTAAGRRAFAKLDAASREQVGTMLEALVPDRRGALVGALREVESLLSPGAARGAPVLLRDLQVGDIGWVVHRQGLLYAQEFGWDETFEALVAEIAGAFAKNYDRARERCWIAEREGRIVGSVFVVRASDTVARLRLLYVEPEARGAGLGRRLVDECIRFARAKGYRKLTLWTNSVLEAARRIYERAGFELVGQERHRSFGKRLVGQTWELAW